MSKIEICWIVLFNLFGNNPDSLSQGYTRKIIRKLPQKLKICKNIHSQAEKLGVDPLLAVSVAFHESRFQNLTSKAGAKGPMGVITKYHCPKNKKCNLINAGIKALDKFLTLNKYELCPSLAQYNRGLKGQCKKGRSEYYYALKVIKTYKSLLNHKYCSSNHEC